jgi:hypothetical protein
VAPERKAVPVAPERAGRCPWHPSARGGARGTRAREAAPMAPEPVAPLQATPVRSAEAGVPTAASAEAEAEDTGDPFRSPSTSRSESLSHPSICWE